MKMKQIRKKSNRTSPKSEKSSGKVKSPYNTPIKDRIKPTTPDSKGAYFQFNKKAKLPEEAEEEARIKRFLDIKEDY